MKTIHWLGVGLSSVPGIRRLASKDYNLNVWNRKAVDDDNKYLSDQQKLETSKSVETQ